MVDITALGFDTVDLANAVRDGRVRSQVHPDKPNLKIYNYTEDVQYRRAWDNVTLACRGLILDHETHSIVARPWKKFFNLGERDNEIDSLAPVEVTDKVDGSLGILYHDGDDWAIATRGSFASEQAIHATKVLHERYSSSVDHLSYYGASTRVTFLFEIVYPENRIVCDYGDLDDLILLGAVDIEYGWYHGPMSARSALTWPGRAAEVFGYENFVSAISAKERKGAEGIVIRSGTKMVKLKQADYVELHRIVSNLSPKTIWEMMRDGKTIEQICEGLPDEFHAYVERIGGGLLDQYNALADAIFADYASRWNSAGPNATRRRYAEAFEGSDYKKYLFLLLDGRSIVDVVWKDVQPRGDVSYLGSKEE